MSDTLSRIDVAAIPLTLYIHIPWCVRKCPYCDFNSHVAPDPLPGSAYLAALLADLDRDLPLTGGRPVEHIFIGGGTPSLLPPEWFDSLLTAVRDRLVVAAGAEITLEANPGAVEQGRFAELRAAGINRLSLGVQSFDDELLAAIGRIHDAGEARAAVVAARQAGFANLNLDLMFGLPGQALAGARRDLAEAIALAPDHLSYYQLTLEPGTPFGRHPPRLPDEDLRWRMQCEGVDALAVAGFQRYEVSAYARPGHWGRHNRNYWEFGDYLAIGAGAHGKLSDAAGYVRTRKVAGPATYLARAGGEDAVQMERVEAPPARTLEFMLNALRLADGFERVTFAARTGVPWAAVAGRLAGLVGEGLIETRGTRYAATPRGLRFLDDLLARFLRE